MKTILIIAIILFCISMLPVKIILSSKNGFCAKLKILFFSFNIPPKKRQKHKMSSKEFKGELKKLRLSHKKSKSSKKSKAKKKKYSSDDIPFYFNLIRDFIEKTYSSARRGLTVRVQKINIIVASEDPAKTAVMYGIVSQSCAYLLEFIESLARIKYKKNKAVTVEADFLSAHTTFDVKIILSWKLYRALCICIATAYRAFMALSAHNKRRTTSTTSKEKIQANNENTNQPTEE